MAIDENVSKIKKFVKVHFVGTVFAGTAFVLSIISLHITTESSIMLATYVPFLELHVAGF